MWTSAESCWRIKVRAAQAVNMIRRSSNFDGSRMMSCCCQAFLVQMMILVSEWMLSYQLSILTIKSPNNFSLFWSWWNSFTKKRNRHRRHDKTRERCIRSKNPLLSAKLWGQRLQPGGATWMRRIPFPISPKGLSFFCFKMIFGIPFKVHVSKTLTRNWRGAVWLHYQSATARDLLSGCRVLSPLSHRSMLLWWALHHECRRSDGFGKICGISLAKDRLSWNILTSIDYWPQEAKQEANLFCLGCVWMSWMNHCCFFLGVGENTIYV